MSIRDNQKFWCGCPGKNLEKRYGTLTADPGKLRETLSEYGAGRVAMESTSIH
jgi:hypothetical protein